MKGYEEAHKIDTMIDILHNQEPMDKHNAAEWARFGRCLKTYGELIEKQAIELMIKGVGQ